MRGICACGLLLAAAASAQSPETVLRVTTRLVQVNVIVEDKKGVPVGGLTRNDFTLFEKDKPQDIRLFSAESSRHAAGTTALPPHIYTNRLEMRSGVPTSVTAILLDGLNTHIQDQSSARQHLIRFLRQIRPEDRVALYTLGKQLRVLHDFTNDPASLMQTVARYSGEPTPALDPASPAPSTPEPDFDRWLTETKQSVISSFTRVRVRQTIDSLEAIANRLIRLPGRKNLVWLSGGFPLSTDLDGPATHNLMDREVFSGELERALRALNNANVAVYPVDARGLFTGDASDSVYVRMQIPAVSLPMHRLAGRSQSTLRIVAERTGGRAFVHTNDIHNSIRVAVEDARINYMLGYYPADPATDGKFRDIKVQVKRPNLRVRHRLGYYATEPAPQDDKLRQTALGDALWSPLDATAVGLDARLDRDFPKSGLMRLVLVAEPANLTFRKDREDSLAVLDVLVVQQSAEGYTLKADIKTLRFRLPPAKYGAILKDGLMLIQTLEMIPSASRLRVLTSDGESGAMGSLTIPLR